MKGRTRIRSLLDFVPAVSPRFARPAHLTPVADLFERIARGEQVEACVSLPPRFGKTELLLHGIVWLLLQKPEMRIGYASYSGRIAEKKAGRALMLAERAHVPLSRTLRSRADWRTGVEEGGLWAAGVDGAWTAEGFELVLVDDPHANRATAESSAERERVHDWFSDVLFTRLEPHGSVIVNHARWHTDDVIGRLSARGMPYVRLPALDDHDRSLWPERWPAKRLVEIREKLGAYGWASLYQGEPRPRGGSLFTDVRLYDAVPKKLTVAIGVDFAYSAKTTSDYSVAVVVGVGVEDEGGAVFYILDVIRVQVKAPEFRHMLGALRERFGFAPIVGFVSGTEKGATDMMVDAGLPIETKPAVADKFVRAQPAAAAWNAGRVFVPRQALWLDAFVGEVLSFTGVKDRHDDQVDALAAVIAYLVEMVDRRACGGGGLFTTYGTDAADPDPDARRKIPGIVTGSALDTATRGDSW